MPKGQYVRLTDDERKRRDTVIMAMHSTGLTAAAIARQIGSITDVAVQNVIHRHGVGSLRSNSNVHREKQPDITPQERDLLVLIAEEKPALPGLAVDRANRHRPTDDLIPFGAIWRLNELGLLSLTEGANRQITNMTVTKKGWRVLGPAYQHAEVGRAGRHALPTRAGDPTDYHNQPSHAPGGPITRTRANGTHADVSPEATGATERAMEPVSGAQIPPEPRKAPETPGEWPLLESLRERHTDSIARARALEAAADLLPADEPARDVLLTRAIEILDAGLTDIEQEYLRFAEGRS